MKFVLGKWDLESERVRSDWGTRALSAGLDFKGRGRHDRYHLDLPIPAGWTSESLFHWALEEVLHYRVFPPHRMKAFVDSPGGQVLSGDTILIGVYVSPFRIQMADRVLDVFEGENEQEKWGGFTYGTLQGHAEKGIETFRIVLEKGSNRVTFFMEAWSLSGHWLTWLFYFWARIVQKKAGREAVQYMAARLKSNPTEVKS